MYYSETLHMYYNETVDNGTYESEDYDPFPDNTLLAALIYDIDTDAKNDEGEKFLKLKWRVTEQGEYLDRKFTQRCWVNAKDESKQKRAHKILLAIDFNCGGDLSKIGREASKDQLLMALKDKQMNLILGVWENDTGKGNWVKAVYAINNRPEQKIKPDDEPF